ncbi:MAG: transcriptional regulator [Acidobacteriia bacterium]|nr:transcriptional regulator [Terriglobia bacterium]
MKFGEFVRGLRARKRMKLREFCLKYGHDPSNWSKVERGELAPPSDRKLLEAWAKQLGVKKGGGEWFRFFDLASIERGKVPDDLMSDKEIVDALPVFFRTFRAKRPTEAELNELIRLLKK